MKRILAAAMLAAVAGTGTAAQAQACRPATLVTAVPMITLEDGVTRAVPVTINAAPRRMLLDTGGYLTQIMRGTAQQLKLPIKQADVDIYDVNGNRSREEASLADFTLGALRIPRMLLPISPHAVDVDSLDGAIAGDLMRRYDADFDFGGNMFRLYSPDHCPGAVPDGKSTAVSVMPIRMVGNHITIPVTLNGKAFTAIIDTGATSTLMLEPAAKRVFGLTFDSPQMEKGPFVNGDPAIPIYLYTFHDMAIGDIRLHAPRIGIIADLMRRNGDKDQLTGTRAKSGRHPATLDEMMIGMNVLNKLRIYMAFAEGKMYVWPASGSAALESAIPSAR